MFTYRRALVALVGGALLAAACSDAPQFPVQETSRNVLAEIAFTDTT
jgi:hypothetical protein